MVKKNASWRGLLPAENFFDFCLMTFCRKVLYQAIFKTYHFLLKICNLFTSLLHRFDIREREAMLTYKVSICFALLFATFTVLWESGSAFIREGRTLNVKVSQEDKIFPRNTRINTNSNLKGYVPNTIRGE